MQEKPPRRFIREMTFFAIALAVVAFDQISKFLVRTNLTIGQVMPEQGFFRITYATNTGGVFGLFTNQTFLISLVAIAGIATILVLAWYAPLNKTPVRVCLALLLGGTVGNLIDRLALGSVVDFIDIGVGQYRWPTFNVADPVIVVSVVILVYYLLFRFGKDESVERRSG
jgi:signal peptidase II